MVACYKSPPSTERCRRRCLCSRRRDKLLRKGDTASIADSGKQRSVALIHSNHFPAASDSSVPETNINASTKAPPVQKCRSPYRFYQAGFRPGAYVQGIYVRYPLTVYTVTTAISSINCCSQKSTDIRTPTVAGTNAELWR